METLTQYETILKYIGETALTILFVIACIEGILIITKLTILILTNKSDLY